MPTVLARLLIVATALSVGCAPGLHFRRVSVLGTTHDPQTQSTRVSVTFEVWHDDEQLTNISRESFRVYEDGRPATSESLSEAGSTEHRVPVVLLLDTSLSMYQANAVGPLKTAAARFVDVLTQNGFAVTVYRFASDVERTASIGEIPDQFSEQQGRWTSLYAAVQRGMMENAEAIVVAFSDGADTYSQNHGVAGLGAIERAVLPVQSGGDGTTRVVHAIGFGNVATESDRQGVPGVQALERLARNGSFHYAQDPGALDAVFQDVANRIRNVYIFDYLSPNLSGAHELVIEVQARGLVARTQPFTFEAGGSGAAVAEAGCANTCAYANDGECDDGGPGALHAVCTLGTDCNDCGSRGTPEGPAAPAVDAARAEAVRQFDAQAMRDAPRCRTGDPAACTSIYDGMESLLRQVPAEEQAAVREQMLRSGAVHVFQHACQQGRQSACAFLTERGLATSPAPTDTPPSAPGGIGAQVRASPDGAVVIAIVSGGGASSAGLVQGDVIVSVDGTELANVDLERAVGVLRGPVGSTASLRVRRLVSGQVEDVDVTRSAIGAAP